MFLKNVNLIKRKFKTFRPAHGVLFLVLGFACLSCDTLRGRVDQSNRRDTTDVAAPKPTRTPPIDLLPFGNPSNAASEPDNYLILHDGHVISYNNGRGTANWVAWRTKRSDLGKSIPRPFFEPDPLIPPGFTRIQYFDYSGSGYDRGHILPSADRFGNKQQNNDSFLMTNIVPQTKDLNQFSWERLESYARSLVYRGNELFTIAGVYGEKERLRNKITVPTNCWKVIVVFDRGKSADSITEKIQIIAVDMPNIERIENADWKSFQTSVRDIELKTGYDFFSTLQKELQEKIESRKSSF